MDEREELERFLKRGASSEAPSSSEKDELEAFLAGGAAAPAPKPSEKPKSQPVSPEAARKANRDYLEGLDRSRRAFDLPEVVSLVPDRPAPRTPMRAGMEITLQPDLPVSLRFQTPEERKASSEAFLQSLEAEKGEAKRRSDLAIEEEASRATSGTVGKMATRLGRSIVRGTKEALQTPVLMSRAPMREEVSARIGEDFEGFGREYLPIDARRPAIVNPLRGDFWTMENLGKVATETVPDVAGSMVPYLLIGRGAGLASRVAGSPAAAGVASRGAVGAFGAAQGYTHGYEAARAAGFDEDTARKSGAIEAIIGLFEGAGSAGTTGQFTQKALSAIPREARQEFIQESFSQLAQGINAAYLTGYDPKKTVMDIVGESLGAGGVGGLLGGAVATPGAVSGARASRAADRAAVAEAVRAEQPAPLDLTPTTIGPTQLISLREAAKPEFRKKLEEAAAPESAPAEAAPVPAPAQAAPVQDVHQALRSSVESAGKLPRAERGTLLDQVFEAAVTRGAPRDAATLDKAIQLAGQGAEAAKAQFNQAFPAGGATAQVAQPAAAPADDLAAAVEGLKSLRKPTEAEAKEAAEEAKKQAKQAGKEFEKQAKRAEKETEKEAKLDEQAAAEAEGEIKRMRLYDESVGAAQSASEDAEAMIDAGDFSGAIGKMRAQQSALGQSLKYLPDTPEAVRTRANVAEIVEGINNRIPELRKQALAGPRPESKRAPAAGDPQRAAQAPKLSKAEQSAQERRQRAETGQRVADRYREQAQAALASGRLLEAHAAYRAELQALNDVMRLTPADDVGRRTQIRNSITSAERDLRDVSGELRGSERKAPRARAVDEDAQTAELPSTPLLDVVNNPEGGVPQAPESASGRFGALARQQAARREAAPQSRRKATETLSPVEYLKRKTGGDGIRVSDRGEAALLGAKEAGIVGLTNRASKWTLSDAQVMLDEGGFFLADGRRFTDPSVTENDVLQFLQDSGKQGRLDTAGLDRRLAEEEAEFYASLAEEEETGRRGDGETGRQEEVFAQSPSARSRTERLPVPKAGAENIDDLRKRREELDRLRYDRSGEFPPDLADERRELGAAIANYENEQAKAASGGRLEDAPPSGARVDDRPFGRATPEDRRRAFAAAEARLDQEAARSAEVLPKSDTELLERGRAAVDALFADIEQDVDALDLLDRAIEGDEDARQELIHFAERSHGVDADTVGAILDARAFGRQFERGHIRKIAQARAGEDRTEAGAARHGEDGEAVEAGPPAAREVSAQELDLLGRNPGDLSVDDLRQYRRDLDQLKADGIRGLVAIPDWAERQLEAKIKQTGQVWDERRKKGEIEPKNKPLPLKAQPLSKTEGGRRLVEQAKKREAASPLARAVGDSPSDETKVKVADLGLDSKVAPARPAGAVAKDRNVSIDDITLGRDDLSRGRMNQVQTALEGGVKPERKGVPLREQVEPIEVVPDPDRPGKWIVDNDGNHRMAYLKLSGYRGDVPVKAWEAPAKKEESQTVVHSNPQLDRQPILAETNRGTVLVANPANKTGVSEVKDRSEEPVEHKFSSTQVNLPPEIAGKIITFGRRIPDADLADDGREEEPHITVKYGLHGWDAKFAEGALAGEGPAQVTFGKVSLFTSNPDFDVVKVEVKSDDLRRLNKKISESQPVTDTHPTYQPHTTVAYVKKGRGARYVGSTFLEGQTVTLDSVTFSGRDGERVEIPLIGKPASELSEQGGLGAALDDIADRAWERIKQRNNGRLPANIDPQDMADIAIWGAAKLAKGAIDFSQWSKAMVKKFGEQVRPHLLNLWQKAKALQTTTPIEKLLAGAEKLSSWRDWYSRHQATVKALFDEDAPLFQQLLAATSQHASVAGNVTMALKAYRQLKTGEPFTGYLPAVIKNLERIRNNEALAGLKISEFGKGTTEVDVNTMAVDMHVADALFGTKRPSPKQIEQAKFIIRTLAAKMGWTPIEMQSVIWAYNQVRQGRMPTDYGEVLTRKADEITALRTEISGREGGSVPPGGGVRQTPADRGTQNAGRDGRRGKEGAEGAGGGTYLGLGLGSLQPLLERGAAVLSRRSKVPIPEDFDINKYIDGVIDALGEAQKRGVPASEAAKLPGELTKLVEAVGAGDGWAVVDAHKRISKIIDSRAPNAEIGKIDASVWENLSALRKAGLLARIPTHVRNILGNTIFQVVEEVSRMPAAMADTLISLGTKRRTVAGPSATASARAVGKAVTEGGREAVQVMRKGLTAKDQEEMQIRETRFRNPVLDAYTKYVFRALSASDAVFYRGAYDRAISERARLRALNEARAGLIERDRVKEREKELRANPDLDTQLAATEDARLAVFRNNNKFSKGVSAVRGALGPGGNFAIDLVMPFDRTPSNIFVRTLEYTPLGYGRNVIQAGRAMMNGEFTPEQQREFARVFGRATTGTFGVMLLGWALAARGLMTGFYDEEDRDRESLRRAAGQAPASVRIGDRWYSMGGLAPLGTLMALGATLHREAHEDVKDEEDRPLKSLRASSKFVFDLPLMRGTKEVVEAAKLPGSLGQKAGRVAASFVPAPVADIGTLADDRQRETGTGLKGLRKVGSEFANEIQARLPVARNFLPPKVDVFGEPITTEKSDVIDPFTSRPAAESVRGLRDLLDLDVGLSKPQREPGEATEEYNARVRERGQELKRTLGELSDDENVRAASRDARRAIYEHSLDTKQMERAGKLSSGSVRVERQVEALRGDAYAALRSIPEYERLSAKDQKAVRELINEELKRFRAEAASVSRGKFRREKRARIPGWTPADLAKAAMEARP